MKLKSYLSKKFEGRESFLENIVFPIFGEEKFEDMYDVEALDNEDLQAMAKRTGIKSAIQYGLVQVGTTEINIYDVTVSDRVMMRRNRVGIQQLIRRIMLDYTSAFIIFHYEDSDSWDWRFSFCQKDNKEVTEAKRYTFLLGPGQSCRTAAENFQKLIDKHGEINRDDIVAAFDVEALSKEFFDKYKAKYEKFCNYIYDNRNDEDLFGHEFAEWDEKLIRDYVKKLLGRIVFLHFLQKKGWLGVPVDKQWGEGDTQFMRNLFKASTPEQKDNYLDCVLEPLFAGALNTQRPNDIFDLGVEGFRTTRIPYLNGGLFERDVLDEPKSTFPASYFEDLFEFFYQYNFTIDENDPNDAEVGIDPEMLGHIFENLLEDNKDKGAFYTPKEIVQYMCRESLIAYLTTCVMKKQGENHKPEDEIKESVRKLLNKPEEIVPRMRMEHLDDFGSYIRNVKICDPAIGSGAFPMGLLNELVRCRVFINAWAKDEKGNLLEGDYAALKTEIISNNIYGVDIEKGAIDIARLRFWLSIIVDEQTPHVLPNFDYKFMQGNSLIPTFDGKFINLETEKINKEYYKKLVAEKKELYRLKQLHYNASGNEKHELDVKIKYSILRLIAVRLGYESRSWYKNHVTQNSLFKDEETSFDIVRKTLPKEKQKVIEFVEALSNKLNDISVPIEKRSQINIHFFDWRIMFTEVFDNGSDGFDIVIGNPPYIKEYENRNAFDGFRENSPYYIGKMDLWHGFTCNAIDLCKNYGIVMFIAQNNWTTNAGACKMRKKVVDETRILQMVDFNDYMVFGESASIQTMIMLFCKDSKSNGYKIDYRKQTLSSGKVGMVQLLGQTGDHCLMRPIFNREFYKGKYITFSKFDDVLTKIDSMDSYLSQDEIAQGIVFPQDFLNKKGHNKIPSFPVGTGIFCLTQSELNALRLTESETKLIKPYYTTEQIHKYYTDENENKLWMIYTDSKFKADNSLDCFPRIKKHLDQFTSVITSDNKPYGLHRARNSYFFTGKKLISLRKCSNGPVFSYSECDCYVSQTFFSIKTNRWNLKFLTGLLNSSLIRFWLQNKGKMQGENYQVDKEPLMGIPLPQTSYMQQNMIELVETIISIKKQDKNSDTTVLEHEIDQLVYKLYGLTDEEIAIVEGRNE